MSKQKTERGNPMTCVPLFGVVLVYLELIFRLATGGEVLGLRAVYALLFGIAYGGVVYLLTSLFRSRKLNFAMTELMLFLSGLLYVVEFLIYKQFKQFYDLNTMTGGAGDALSSYFADVLNLIFPQGGIFVMLLLFAPALLYPFLSRRWVRPLGGNVLTRVVAVLLAVCAYATALLTVSSHPVYGPVYSTQYNFQSAVSDFGLLTGLRLDLKRNLFGSELDFEDHPAGTTPDASSDTDPEQSASETPPESSGSQTPPEVSSDPVPEVTYNEVDIDFEALNSSAPDSVKKLNNYVSSLSPSNKNEYTGLFEGKNLILISAEAFSAEVIDPVRTPTLYRLATKGIQFTDFYQPDSAGTTGGEYQNIFGMLPMDGGRSFKETADHLNYYTIASQLDRLGYYGKAYHNNSYTYYDRNRTHINIGYSDGFMGYGNGMEQYVKKRWPQSDYEMFVGTLDEYIDKQPFSIYYMTVSGHSSYTRSGNSMTYKNWDRVKDLPYSDDVKGYLAANMELEDALTYLVETLEAKGIADDTVIALAADHFPYGLDNDGALGSLPLLSELYGYNVETYFQRDHSRLILWCGSLEDEAPIVVDSPTFSLDLLPTLSNLFGVEFDSRLLPGRDVFSDAEALVFNTNYDWKTDLGTYYASKGTFVPASEDTVIPEGYVDRMKSIVRNKVSYCSGVLDTDYFRYLFG